jgi:2-phospho-L-lactate transferase/gluconeogenesis factor (CofD/UPF0052 family)
MDQKPRPEPSSYFSVPESHWRDVGAEGYRNLSRLHAAMGIALARLEEELKLQGEDVAGPPVSGVAPSPAELALQMHEVAGEILSGVASDEQDLRQIITTLRTAFAVTWDLYSFKETERITVAEHMDNLRARIDDFERELNVVRQAKRDAMS